MNTIPWRTQVYGIAACVVMLAGVGCNGGPGGSNSSRWLAGPRAAEFTRETSERHYNRVSDTPAQMRLPKTFPVGITLGPDGTMWFTERGLGRLGSITTDGSLFGGKGGRGFKLTGQARQPQIVTTGSGRQPLGNGRQYP